MPSVHPTQTPTSSPSVNCVAPYYMFQITLKDDGGDGWQGATYSWYNRSNDVLMFNDTLEDGSQSVDHVCIDNGCWSVVIGGGAADEEILFIVKETTTARR